MCQGEVLCALLPQVASNLLRIAKGASSSDENVVRCVLEVKKLGFSVSERQSTHLDGAWLVTIAAKTITKKVFTKLISGSKSFCNYCKYSACS